MCPVINAASSGGSRFIVTSGLVETGDRCLLIGGAAHALARDTLGHVQSARAARTGVNTAANLVGAFIPFGGLVVQLAAIPGLQAYSRSQEADADREAIVILERAGQPRWMLRYALDFLTRWQGEGGGGRLSAHPARQDRLAGQPPIDAPVGALRGPDIEMDSAGRRRKRGPGASRPPDRGAVRCQIGRASCGKECRSRWSPYH